LTIGNIGAEIGQKTSFVSLTGADGRRFETTKGKDVKTKRDNRAN